MHKHFSILSCIGLSSLMVLSTPLHAFSTLTEVNDKEVIGVSPNAQIIFGKEGLKWSEQDGFQPIATYDVTSCSNSGEVCIGAISSSEAFIWNKGEDTESLNSLLNSNYLMPGDITANGEIIVGSDISSGNGFYWETSGNKTDIPPLDSRPYSSVRVNAISNQGEYIAGTNIANNIVGQTPEYEAFFWTSAEGMTPLGDLPGGNFYSQATDVSDNGTVVGYSLDDNGYMAFRWTQDGGMQPLGTLETGCYSQAWAVSADGSTVIGESCFGSKRSAFIWNESQGMRKLLDVLEQDYSVDINNCNGSSCSVNAWKLRAATGISDDGKTIVGWGYNPSGNQKGWVAQVNRPIEIDSDKDGLSDSDETALNLLPTKPDTDNNNISDGLEHGRIIKGSVTHDFENLNNKTTTGKISSDGRYTVFSTYADNVISNDNNNKTDIFRRDNVTGNVIRVSLTNEEQELISGVNTYTYIAINDDANLVVFSSNSDDLLSNSSSYEQIFVRDIAAGTTELISISTTMEAASGNSRVGGISKDGRYIVYSSSASDIVSNDSNGKDDIFLYDRQNRITTRISTGLNGEEANDSSYNAEISSDGNYVVFSSRATNLVTQSVISSSNLYLYDITTQSKNLISVSSNNELSKNTHATIRGFSISGDGSSVAFTFAGDLIDTDSTVTQPHAYLRDVTTNTTIKISSDSVAGSIRIAQNGLGIAYSEIKDVLEEDNNQKQDIYFWDRSSNTSNLIAINNESAQAIDSSTIEDISDDGTLALISSKARNLVIDDTNEASDLFIVKTSPLNAEDLITIEILSPSNGSVYSINDTIELSATATAPIDGDISATIVWNSDQDGLIGNGNFLQTQLSAGTHNLSARASGTSGTRSNTVYGIHVQNNPPAVSISSPSAGNIFSTGDLVTFSGNAHDVEDGDLSQFITWESDIYGPIGTGSSISKVLSGGIHTISAKITDRYSTESITSIEIQVINTAPQAQNDTLTVDEAGTGLIDLAANDSDLVEGLNLNSITIISPPNNGSLIVNNDGSAAYTHNGSETATDSFTYTIQDNAGVTSNTATANITINLLNDSPVASPDSISLLKGESATVNLTTNDVDPDDGIDVTSIDITSLPSSGSVSINNDGSILYTHNDSNTLIDSFTYTVQDTLGAVSNSAIVSIVIQDPTDRFPFEEDFQSDLPTGDDWSYYSSNSAYGRIQTISGKLRMDVSTNGQYSLNEMVMNIDMAGVQSAQLSFFQSDHGDEPHPMPESFTGHHNSDGVAISNDGNTWYRLIDSSRLEVSNAGQDYIIDLDEIINKIQTKYDPNFNYTSEMKFKFQQYDNYSYPTDGREWDNITIDASYSGLSVTPNQTIEIDIVDSISDTFGCESFEVTNISQMDLHWQANSDQPWLTLPANNEGDLSQGNSTALDACWDASAMTIGTTAEGNITFTDTTTGDQSIHKIKIRILPEQLPLAYQQDFSQGLPSTNEGWDFYSSSSVGRIAVISSRLRMDVSSSGTFTLNEGTITLDLTNQSNITLSFFQSETSDELHTMPASFSGHHNSDGVAISNDGVTWYQIVSTTELDVGEVGKTFSINLDNEIARIKTSNDPNFDYGRDFKIKFQQYDNYTNPSDGREWDSITLSN
ncbi:Ig-like domain-containing protein [Litoribrevibacter euphylliae]|uniref:Ig-like domain-containing protein n=1 Tax=Litoribrevibacter euphylliae TaxID=1834034 RepID=A0ABV7H6B0_9GAMM